MTPKTKANIREQIGQLLIIGFNGVKMSARISSLLTQVQPAGVILFARNITSAEQTYKLLKDCQACVSVPMFTCVDMEGGTVDRLRNIFGRSPSAADVFASGDRKLFRKHGKVIGESCRALGFNTDFAPVVDLAFPASRTVMSSRAVSADPKQAVLYAREFLAGLRSASILGSAKHFPGLGEANLDTHQELPNVDKSWKKLWDGRHLSLSRHEARVAYGPDWTRQLSPRYPCRFASFSVEKMDHRCSAAQDRLLRFDRLGRSGNGWCAQSRSD